MGEKKITTVDELKKAYIQLKKDYDYLFYSILLMYQNLTSDTENIMYFFDPKKKNVYFNPKGTEVLGIPAISEFKGEETEIIKCIDESSKEEFINMCKKVYLGEAKELTGTVKLCLKSGEKAIYEHKILGMLDSNGNTNGVCFGCLKDVTERYIKDMRLERYQKMVRDSVIFNLYYDQRMDMMRVTIPKEARVEGRTNEISNYFWSKLVKEGKVCPPKDIPVLLDFLKNGSSKPIQIQLYEPNGATYRWFAITGEVENGKLKGKLTDITDFKNKFAEHERLEKVLECLNRNFVFIAQVDIKKDAYEILLLDQKEFHIPITQFGCFTELHQNLSVYVEDQYLTVFSNFGSMDYLSGILSAKSRIEMEYKLKDCENPWRLETVQVMESDESGNPVKIIVSHAVTEKFEIEQESSESNSKDVFEDQTQKAHILLAEDYVLNAEYARSLLEEAGIRVKWVQNGTGVVKTLLDAQKGEFDFILMDMKMPQLDGIEATYKVREIDQDIPIIGMSLSDCEEIRQKALACGMNDLIEKPVTPKQIQYLLKNYVNLT